MHQFLDAALVAINPDDPKRPTNSGKTVYQIEGGLLELLKTWGTPAWEKSIRTYLASIETLQAKYAQQRKTERIPLTLPTVEILLSPGGQNILVKRIIDGLLSPARVRLHG